MVDVNKSSKMQGEKLFPRWLLFGLGGFFTLAYLEFNVLQIFRAQLYELEFIYQQSGLLTLFLFIPFIAFVITPLTDKANKLANKRAILIRLSKNRVYAKRLDCDISHECFAEFSQQTEIVSEMDMLVKAVREAFRECTKDTKLPISPYVVFTATKQLSKVQRIAAEQAISEAGALCVHYMAECESDLAALEFVRQNPRTRNFA